MDDNELDELYQAIILGHNRNPKNEGTLEPNSGSAEGYNPLCGDKITVYVRKDGGLLEAATFEGEGCAISRASASIMTTLLKDLTPEQAHARAKEVYEMLSGPDEPQVDVLEMGDLAALVGVRKFPARIKCATLAWHALEEALG